MNNFGMYQQRYVMGINWVEGAEEVGKIELPPGQMAVFIDRKNDGKMYIKSRDTYNVYNTQTFDFKEIVPAQPESPYVTKTELREILQEILGGKNDGSLREINSQPTATGSTGESAGGGNI